MGKKHRSAKYAKQRRKELANRKAKKYTVVKVGKGDKGMSLAQQAFADTEED